MKQLSWTLVLMIDAVLIIIAALSGVLLAQLFPDISQIWVLPMAIAIVVIVSLSLKMNSRKGT